MSQVNRNIVNRSNLRTETTKNLVIRCKKFPESRCVQLCDHVYG